jgi:SAM-dependent methyltransferase
VAGARRANRNLDRNLVKIYRTAEDYRRYAPDNSDRQTVLKDFYRKYRRYFGRSVLDLACGGGVLGGVLARSRLSYVGIDANPDMIHEARTAKRNSRQRFVLGDIRRSRIAGRFDTVALLGNSLAHLSVADMTELLSRRASNVHRGTTFLVDYRDLVAMFWNGSWSKVKIQTHVRGRVVHRARLVDLEGGKLHMRARPSSRGWVLDWAHAIWSPFILESLMQSHGWQLVRRSPASTDSKVPPEHYIDVYRLEPKRADNRARRLPTL